ncbi:hypothetical protein F4776DRAFT_644322 [Hypoxylon sp. NC0597]|nr:hypothetical protein F4776DRAFT_644322 [Hypoxylon sp. NC0597]
MNETLRSIITGEKEWCFDTEGRSIKFNKDGTGEMWCRCNFNYWIAADIEWKDIGPPHDSGQIVETPNEAKSAIANKTGPQLLGKLTLEITLTKRLPQWVQSSNLSKSTMVNEYSLTGDAYRPKTFTVRMEKGNFMVPCFIGYSGSDKPRFALRLLFDKSPYSPRSEWKEPERGADGGQFWDHVEFVGRPSRDLEMQGRAMNDISSRGWNECVVS